MEEAPPPRGAPGPPGDARPHVLVAVTTYRRPELLDDLLPLVRAQCVDLADPTRILVVDNDAARSAHPTALRHGVGYLCVDTPGIAAARQGALDAADRGDLLVMVDDDVTPEAHWLEELLDVWRETRASAVMGHVHYVWPATCDPWLVDTGYMRRTRRTRGQRLHGLATTNVLIDVDAVRDLGVSFDLGLGTGGGEDTVFGRDLLTAGGSIVAAPDSIVRDEVPEERATKEFATTRTITHGQALSHLHIAQSPPGLRPIRALAELAGGLARLAVFSSAALVVPASRDRRRNAVLTRRSWFARGRILGAMGRLDSIYARPSSDG